MAGVDDWWFLQSIPPKKRRKILKRHIPEVDSQDRANNRGLRKTRDVCGCSCNSVCYPDTCECAQNGIPCQVFRLFLKSEPSDHLSYSFEHYLNDFYRLIGKDFHVVVLLVDVVTQQVAEVSILLELDTISSKRCIGCAAKNKVSFYLDLDGIILSIRY